MEKYVSFDLGLLSKYRYYTGVIFKAYTYGVGDAVAKGGRYNSLLKYFGKDAPAIGFVIVVDDLLEALSRQKRKPQPAAEGILIIYEEGRKGGSSPGGRRSHGTDTCIRGLQDSPG